MDFWDTVMEIGQAMYWATDTECVYIGAIRGIA